MRRTLIFIFSILGTAVVSLLIGYFSGVVVARDAYDACAAEQEECRQDAEDASRRNERYRVRVDELLQMNQELFDVSKHLAEQLEIDLDTAKAELADAKP